jgi:hypothetical protein
METYFKFKMITDYVIPILFFLGLLLVFLYGIIKSHMKDKLMEKLGYTYDKGLGTNVALEFQSQWVKGNTRINYRRIRYMRYRDIKKYVKNQEERKNG